MAPTANKKVKNATRVTVDGIEFRSKHEAYCWGLAKQLGIPVAYEGRKFVLIEGFRYAGRKWQAITHTPDFCDPSPALRYIVEIKGFANDTYPLYRKLLMRHLGELGLNTKFYLCTTQKETAAALADIKQRFYS